MSFLRLGVFAAAASAVAVAALGPPPPAAAQDVARGAAHYQLCAACHGDQGAGSEPRGAPAIAGLPGWYVDAQLRKFRSGQRGYAPDDETGLQMRPMATALRTDEDVASVAAYVARLPPAAPAPTLAGDATRGQALFAPCSACHGPDGGGNEALKGPRLAGQPDWYLLAQLVKFKSGARGAHKDDATGAQMRAMASTLVDERAMLDVVAYVRTLRAGEGAR
ncbi:MAG: c-type cytochrome [Deltaproteobacteria bacterium]|nr:c-type cytochrome [Deltaproteobacteria bacterium]